MNKEMHDLVDKAFELREAINDVLIDPPAIMINCVDTVYIRGFGDQYIESEPDWVDFEYWIRVNPDGYRMKSDDRLSDKGWYNYKTVEEVIDTLRNIYLGDFEERRN